MGKRVPFATKIDEELKLKLQELSKSTHIPQSKLIDEAIEHLIGLYDLRTKILEKSKEEKKAT